MAPWAPSQWYHLFMKLLQPAMALQLGEAMAAYMWVSLRCSTRHKVLGLGNHSITSLHRITMFMSHLLKPSFSVRCEQIEHTLRYQTHHLKRYYNATLLVQSIHYPPNHPRKMPTFQLNLVICPSHVASFKAKRSSLVRCGSLPADLVGRSS